MSARVRVTYIEERTAEIEVDVPHGEEVTAGDIAMALDIEPQRVRHYTVLKAPALPDVKATREEPEW